MIYRFLDGLGRYFLFLGEVFHKPEHGREYLKSFFREIELLGFSRPSPWLLLFRSSWGPS
jgi:hypothetical protein